MSDGSKIKVSVDNDWAWAIIIAFFLFWQQNGWYRVDCALGVQKACNLIAGEKEYAEAKP
ncbi:hypothetical protein [Rhizobium rhizogenes]|uniref:hypothetical protein n=1 Tax=Rhizobium rhizogenes TaxID=359 RepID=UPI00226EED83|nr:hypothetical protein [Rhizobium rhizogenes]